MQRYMTIRRKIYNCEQTFCDIVDPYTLKMHLVFNNLGYTVHHNLKYFDKEPWMDDKVKININEHMDELKEMPLIIVY